MVFFLPLHRINTVAKHNQKLVKFDLSLLIYLHLILLHCSASDNNLILSLSCFLDVSSLPLLLFRKDDLSRAQEEICFTARLLHI